LEGQIKKGFGTLEAKPFFPGPGEKDSNLDSWSRSAFQAFKALMLRLNWNHKNFLIKVENCLTKEFICAI
jgi:hypothetical protein